MRPYKLNMFIALPYAEAQGCQHCTTSRIGLMGRMVLT